MDVAAVERPRVLEAGARKLTVPPGRAYVRGGMATTSGGLATEQQMKQVMMTLSALAVTAATARPSGETLEAQQHRILAGLNAQLENNELATQGEWAAVWVGLSPDRANLAYIAQSTSEAQEYAVVLRGTVASSPIDLAEDIDVDTMVLFAAGGIPPPPAQLGQISQGAMEAFTEITGAAYVPEGTTLLQTLTALMQGASGTPTIYVTGHSLGGAAATTVALWLKAQAWSTTPAIQVYTFAAPTAGDANFASWFDQQFPGAICVWNRYDVVPNAWWNMLDLQRGSQSPTVWGFYPEPAVPASSGLVHLILGELVARLGDNVYVQPTQQAPLNDPLEVYQTFFQTGLTQTEWWEAQAAFQHANGTYLQLLQAPPLPSLVPTVTGVDPASGPENGGATVEITGTNFTPDCVVDFGTVSATAVAIQSETSIAAIAPPMAGTVDVTVTNMFGTSESGSADQFTTPPS